MSNPKPPYRAPSASVLLQSVVTRPSRADVFWKALIGGAFLLMLGVCVHYQKQPIQLDLFGVFHHVTIGSILWSTISALSLAYGATTLFYALKYKPVASPTDANLPTCTVLVPAYNEGHMVRIALLSALANDYPREKLHIIAVDDGSTDDTWKYIDEVARANPDVVTAVRMAKNGGKREALREGFLRARGEVVVTVDSDSKLEPDALRQIVAPIVKDRDVACVAGKVLVLNRYDSVLTRLLAARFFITFDFTRAVQSRFGAVLCCPGALTAYRRTAVLEVLDKWSAQTFMGSPCTIGEDRALTTWLLRAGYRSVYQASGMVHTVVPTTIRGVVKMLIRWERGNVRENIVLLPLLFTKWRPRDRFWPTFEVAFELIQYPLGYAVIAISAARFIDNPMTFLRVGAITMGCFLLVQSLCCLRSERSTDFVYNIGFGFFALIGLQWVFPYSCFTIRDGRWMTR